MFQQIFEYYSRNITHIIPLFIFMCNKVYFFLQQNKYIYPLIDLVDILEIRKENNMKLNFIWDKMQEINEIEIKAHPVNKEKLISLKQGLRLSETLNVLDPKNNRKLRIDIEKVEVIVSFGHLSKIVLISKEEYLLQKRLKELLTLEDIGFFRINNSSILNLSQVTSFSSSEHARLEVFTKNNNTYLVSRHYAKLIKEKLL